MRKEFCLILAVILILTAAFCIAGEPYSTHKDSSTGDIEVFSRGCNPPPYENGMDLLLNKTPDKEDTLRLRAFVQFLRDSVVTNQWNNVIEDSFPYIDEAGKAFLIEFAKGYTSLFHEHNTIPFTMFTVAKATSDSQGHFVFEEVEPGLFQIMCKTGRPPVPIAYAKNKPIKDTTLNKDYRDPQRTQTPSQKPPPDKQRPDKISNDRWIYTEKKDNCLPGAVNLIRVAPDSVSVVYVFEYDTGGVEIDAYHPDEWEGRMYKRTEGGE
jgi:hypothetical protein